MIPTEFYPPRVTGHVQRDIVGLFVLTPRPPTPRREVLPESQSDVLGRAQRVIHTTACAWRTAPINPVKEVTL